MKNISGLLVLSLILTSCYSYRTIEDNETIMLGKKYQIRTLEDKKQNARILQIGDTIRGISTSGKEVKIPSTRVSEVRKRKFSLIKTLAVPGVALGGLFVLLTSTFQVDIGEMESPN